MNRIEEIRERLELWKAAMTADRIKIESGKRDDEYFVRMVVYVSEAEGRGSRIPSLFGITFGLNEDIEYLLEALHAAELRGAERLRDFAESFLNPEAFGWTVTREVRDRAREVLGLDPVEVLG